MRPILLLCLLGGLAAAAAAAAAVEPDLHFAPQGLYGHINGGAELFLEFGFEGLDVYHHGRAGAPADDPQADDLSVEVYRMRDHAAALGIYLAKCGRERPWPDVPARNTGNAYQLTAVRGRLFVQVNNFDGDAGKMPEMARLARAHLEAEPDAGPLSIWDALPAEGRVPGSEFLFRGRFALDPIFTFGPGDPLLVEHGALGAGARYAAVDDEPIKQLVVVYAGEAEAAAALAHLRANLDPYISVVHEDDGELIFRDWEDRYGRVRTAHEKLLIELHLSQIPQQAR